MRKLILLAFDLSVFAVSPILALWFRDNFSLSWQKVIDILPYTAWGVVIAAICIVIAGTHRSIWRYTSLSDFARLVATVSISITLTLVLMFSLNRLEGVARSIPIIQWFLIVFTMSSARIGVRVLQRKFTRRKSVKTSPLNKHDILIVGASALTELYLRSVDEVRTYTLNVVGILDEFPALKGRSIHGRKVLGTPAELPEILARLNVHGVEVRHVVITSPFEFLSYQSIEVLLRYERNGTISLDMFERRMGFRSFEQQEFERQKTAQLETPSPDEKIVGERAPAGNFGYAPFKRLLDIIGGILFAILFSPIIALTCVLVALDVGFPLTFWQQRPGRNRRNFRLYKFRTMSDAHDQWGRRIPDDERSSRLGLFMRKSRLDELPQLYNILIGEMSFVGPRPLLPIDQPFKMQERLEIRPGLTGWAQVQGGKTVSADDKAVLDLWYIKNSGLWLDIKIVLKTSIMIFAGERLNLPAVGEAYRSLGIKKQIHVDNMSEIFGEGHEGNSAIESTQKIA